MPLNDQWCPDRVPDQGDPIERPLPESVAREIADRDALEAAQAAVKNPWMFADISAVIPVAAAVLKDAYAYERERRIAQALLDAAAGLKEIHDTGRELAAGRVMPDGKHSEHCYLISEIMLGL